MAEKPSMNKPGAVVIDANFSIALAAREIAKEAQAKATLAYYIESGYLLFAPGVIVSETLFVLCGKKEKGLLNSAEYAQAVADFVVFMEPVFAPPNGDGSLVLRAAQICDGYGCARSADAIYIALAEDLSKTYTTRLLTFDRRLRNQAARHAPGVTVHLLT